MTAPRHKRLATIAVTLTVGDGKQQFVYQRKLDVAPETKALGPGEK